MTTTKSLENAIGKGREALANGALDAAREYFGLALSEQPDNAEILHAVGNLELQAGNFTAAEHHLRKAIALNRYGVGYQNSLGNLLVAQRKYREAESAYFEELRMRPEYALSHHQLGHLMMRVGNYKRAAKHYQSAAQFAPEVAAVANNLGSALFKTGQYSEAADAFKRALHLQPRYGEAQANLGMLKLHEGQFSNASQCFDQALEFDANCAVAYKGIGHLSKKQGNIDAALTAYRKAAEIAPFDVEPLQALAQIWRSQGAWETATELYTRALELAPNDVELLNEFAAFQVHNADNAGAIENYERALQIRPSDQESLAGYGLLKVETGDTKLALSKLSSVVQSGRAGTELLGVYALLLGRAGRGREGIAIIEQRLRKKMPANEKCQLHFTLGKLLDADGSYDLAYHHFRNANELNRTEFDHNKFRLTCERVMQQFSAANMAAAARSNCSADNLVFLVGMPRSGLRVIEQLLALQEQIVDLRSSTAIEVVAYRISREASAAWPLNPGQIKPLVLNKFAQAYRDQVGAGSDNSDTRFLDATWRNFLYIGLIEQLFPKARIIYCTRDDRDIALSSFFNNLQNQPGIPYAGNMKDIAAFVNGYKQVMAHWQKTLSLPLHIVSYERMILEYEEEVGALREFLGVAQSAVADTVSPAQKLPTPSFLKSTSLRRFRHYRVHLESFVEDLETPPDKVF